MFYSGTCFPSPLTGFGNLSIILYTDSYFHLLTVTQFSVVWQHHNFKKTYPILKDTWIVSDFSMF